MVVSKSATICVPRDYTTQPATEFIAAKIARYGKKPGRKRCPKPKFGRAAQRKQERILRDVLCFRPVAEIAGGKMHNSLAVFLDKFLEGGKITIAGSAQETMVGVQVQC